MFLVEEDIHGLRINIAFWQCLNNRIPLLLDWMEFLFIVFLIMRNSNISYFK
jgi:hypothetical protein